MLRYLTCVLRGNMFMTDDSVDQSRQGSAAERRSRPARAPGRVARGSAAVVTRVRPVRASSIPVPGGSLPARPASRSHGGYGADHAQASAEHGASAAEVCEKQWPDYRSDRDTRVERVSRCSKKAWLSRKYAYQILLIEELARQGVETLFVKAPQGASAEDQLLVQFQGMIAEYERAQILERSRRGKRHRAHSGEVSVMSGAPYGYRYIRKTDEAPAAYIVDEAEAHVVRRAYEMYTVEGLSIGEITRRLNAESIPPRKSGRWERSVVWGVLRNSAYRGVACFGKTRVSGRTRVMRPQRRRGVTMPSTTASHERPREDWIEIPVPALVSEESFARAQELLRENKIRSRRRTIAPSVVQGLVSCAKCGYAFSRTSTQTSARKIHYYKCIGSDSWRKLGGPVCDNRRFVRQELLDQIVWAEVIRLLEEPALLQQELDRRLAAARSSDPTRKHEQSLQRELIHVGKGIERIVSAYQEGLLSIEQLRERMPALRQREQTLRAELQAIADQTNDRAAFLRLAETLTAFLARLRSAAETLSVTERQRIVRLLVKDVLVGEDTITIRHSIPIPSGPPQNGGSQPEGPNYLLCKGRDRDALR